MFGRHPSADADCTAAAAESEALGKGRPTPKRKEAEAARKKRIAPPRNRKEASEMRRARTREQRVKQREALAGGDERYLPVRDQGPVKRFIRDWVDARRTIGEFLIPVFIVMFILAVFLAPYVASVTWIAWLLILIALGADSIRLATGIHKAVAKEFGVAATKGITMYTLMRAWQMRRLRIPKPTPRPKAPTS